MIFSRGIPIVCSAIILSLSTSASATDYGVVDSSLNRSAASAARYKGYYKRDRTFLTASKSLSPSQLHEIYGLRVGGALHHLTSDVEQAQDSFELQQPSVTARVLYGNRLLSLGLGTGYTDGTVAGSDERTENFSSRWVIPQLAITPTPNLTFGFGLEIVGLTLRESTPSGDDPYRFNIDRYNFGVSYHTPKLELGIAYTTEATDKSVVRANDAPGSLSLAPSPAARRDLYVPSQATLFARGNLNRSISILSSLGHSRYDGNHAGAIELFDNYDQEDRIRATLEATYWDIDQSHITMGLAYAGGATAAPSIEENGLGYHLANLYGANFSGYYSLSRMAYFGLAVNYMRGEEDETFNGVRYSVRETQSRFSASFAWKL